VRAWVSGMASVFEFKNNVSSIMSRPADPNYFLLDVRSNFALHVRRICLGLPTTVTLLIERTVRSSGPEKSVFLYAAEIAIRNIRVVGITGQFPD